MRYHLPLCFPLPFWSMQRSRKNSQPFVFRPDRIGGFMSNELAMYSGLFWNKEAFSFRSRLPKLVSILLPLISLDFRCYASKTSTSTQLSRFYGWLLKKFYARPPLPILEWRALRFLHANEPFIWGQGGSPLFWIIWRQGKIEKKGESNSTIDGINIEQVSF